MHMSDALLSPAVGLSCWAAAAGLIRHSARRVAAEYDEASVPLMGVMSAFVFAAQMINFTVPGTGSSGHLSGGLLLAVFLGPWRGFLAVASVLVIQALFFADGGLLALGANMLNIGFFACFLVYPWIWRPLAQGRTGLRLLLGTVVSAILVLQIGAFGVVLQTVLSGISDLPFSTFVLFMQPIHLAIGLVEGLVTAGILLFVQQVRPDLLPDGDGRGAVASAGSQRPVLLGFLAAALVVGGLLSWYASENPDGLEWSIARTTGAADLAADGDGLRATLARWQARLSLLPDYGFATEGDEAGDARAGTTVSGAVGVGLVLATAAGLGVWVRARGAGKSGKD